MTKHYSTSGRIRINFFIPAHAILGYADGIVNDPTAAERRLRYIDFSQKLHAVLGPTLGSKYRLFEGLTVLTSIGLAGPAVHVDCLAVTTIGVFVISQIDWAGKVDRSIDKDKLQVSTAGAMTELHPCPLRYTAPVVHYLGAILDDVDCPIESIAVSDNETCEFGLDISTSFLKLSELHYFFRVKREHYRRSGARFVDIEVMQERLLIGCMRVLKT
ncbi:hypothetical protein AB4Y32_05270 [Paraburkholderia phymatum]|uniref:Uncharacterized protein n=1 Tax=Paraburkholderia phymatum TaxID=148447 RepID=A0ACC6TUX0_9BURK